MLTEEFQVNLSVFKTEICSQYVPCLILQINCQQESFEKKFSSSEEIFHSISLSTLSPISIRLFSKGFLFSKTEIGVCEISSNLLAKGKFAGKLQLESQGHSVGRIFLAFLIEPNHTDPQLAQIELKKMKIRSSACKYKNRLKELKQLSRIDKKIVRQATQDSDDEDYNHQCHAVKQQRLEVQRQIQDIRASIKKICLDDKTIFQQLSDLRKKK